MDYAFNYTKTKGSCTSKYYPYADKGGYCKANHCIDIIKTNGCANIWTGDVGTTESILNYVVAYHPVSIAVAAGSEIWMGYSGGIVNGSACYDQKYLDHGVVIVGYNRTGGGLPYWIVKNSWGPGWGEDGYIYIAMDGNVCGVAEDPSFPILG